MYIVFHVPLTAGQAKHVCKALVAEMATWGPAPGQDRGPQQKGGYGKHVGMWWEKRWSGKGHVVKEHWELSWMF